MSATSEVVKAKDLKLEHVGKVVSFNAETGVNAQQGIQVGMAGHGSGKLLGYFVMAEGEYVSLAIEGYSHHIAVSNDDEITIPFD